VVGERAPASTTRVGCDVVEIGRLERVLARNPAAFRDRIFTAAEQAAAGSIDYVGMRFGLYFVFVYVLFLVVVV
jgi:hypothetical protein